MVYSFDSFNYLIKLNKDERLSEAIAQFTDETKIEGATVELFIHCAYQPTRRKTDPAVGLQTLDL